MSFHDRKPPSKKPSAPPTKASARFLGRRQFLKTAGAATAGVMGLPLILPRSVFAAGATPPSERITLGLVGMGKQMRGHLSAFLGTPSVQVVAVCDVESGRLKIEQERTNDTYAQRESKGSYKGCAAYKDFRELVARDNIDAVLIAVPDHWHALIAIAAAKSGKDVYCEKPLSLTITEGKAMVEAVRRYDRVFQTGSQQRSSREFRTACELVRNGRIGKVHTVNVNVGGPSAECYLPAQPVPEGLDWDMWLGPAPFRPFHSELAPPFDFQGWPNWRGYRDYSGGGMTDWGAHHFDIAQWGLGMDETGPTEIIPPDGKGHDRLTYRYANGVTMYHGGAPEKAGVEFIGDKGRVLVNRGYIATDPPEILKEPIGPGDIHLYKSDDHHGDWLDCIRTRKRPICDVAIGYRSITVCHLGNIAYLLKRPLKWDPVNEHFVGDDEANRLMLRPMRSPWRV